jgi:hypothetical protein
MQNLSLRASHGRLLPDSNYVAKIMFQSACAESRPGIDSMSIFWAMPFLLNNSSNNISSK